MLYRLETDKVDVEVGAPRAGVLARIARREGEDVKIGEVLGVVEADTAPGPEEARGRGQTVVTAEVPKVATPAPSPAGQCTSSTTSMPTKTSSSTPTPMNG